MGVAAGRSLGPRHRHWTSQNYFRVNPISRFARALLLFAHALTCIVRKRIIVVNKIVQSWDTERHGTLNTKELRGALRSLNMRLSAIQAQEVSR